MKDDLKVQREMERKEVHEANKRLDRSAVGLTLSPGDSIELSNGITLKYMNKKLGRKVSVGIAAPRDVGIFRIECDEEANAISD